MNKHFDWRIFWILLAAATFGVVAVLPYTLALQQNSPVLKTLKIPLWQLLVAQTAQTVVLLAIAIAVGLLLANRIGLGLPLLEAKLRGESIRDRVRAILPISIVLGLIGGALIVALDAFVFQPAMKAELGAAAAKLAQPVPHPGPLRGFLASFYGGIDEEILLRLFVMTLLAWLGHFVSRTADGKPTTAVLWTANILAAVLFGLGHMPAALAVFPLTPMLVVREIVLNGLVGVACGYLYFTRGLESAMISHFSADLVLHVLLGA
ncbi:MAG: CPBP family intramembrane glutamic endopeptidase [Anaerolineae bacterium]